MNQGSKNGYSYYYFYEYLPTRFEATDEQQRVRKVVYAFKDGGYSPMFDNIINGMNQLITGDRNQWAICCIPASTAAKTRIRFDVLMTRLSSSLRVNNGYPLITVKEDHEAGHLGVKAEDIIPSLNFSSSSISGKKIILIDDVITRGKSFYQVACKLQSLGAATVIGFFIAKTINPNWQDRVHWKS